MGGMAIGWQRPAPDSGTGLEVQRRRVVTGWIIGVRDSQPADRIELEDLSRERSHRQNGFLENLRRRLADGRLCFRSALFRRRRGLRLWLRANPLASLRGQRIEVESREQHVMIGCTVRRDPERSRFSGVARDSGLTILARKPRSTTTNRGIALRYSSFPTTTCACPSAATKDNPPITFPSNVGTKNRA